MSKFLEIPLREFNEKQIQEAIEKLKECQDLISEDLVDSVEIYEGIKLKNNIKEIASRRLSRVLNQIDLSDGWHVFIKFFDIRTKDNESPKLIQVMPLLDNPVKPNLPWSLPVTQFLFKEKTEDLLLNPGTYDLNFEELIGTVETFDPIQAETIKRMQMGVHRNKVIIDLLMNLGLMEALDIKPKISALNKEGKVTNKLPLMIDGLGLKSYVKKIFLKHYLKEQKNVIEQKIFPEKVKMASTGTLGYWDLLLAEAGKLNDIILKVKQEYQDSIINHQFSEKLQVFDAIRKFLQSNNLDEENPPSIPELQNKFKAYGLVKKISKGPGMGIVKKEYLPWLTREKIKENQTLDPYNKKKTIMECADSLGVKIKDIKDAISFHKIRISEEDNTISFEDEDKIKRYLIDKFNPNKIQSANPIPAK